jgi:uncharacterized membrane protein YphA (DoxX/SURF4 family)
MGCYRIIRIILGIIFLWSGLSKLTDISLFGVLINAYGLIPKSWGIPSALILASLEIMAGIGLVVDLHGSLGIVTGLTILFIMILLYGIHMGLDIDCGCFGPSDPEAKAFHGLRQALYRDFVIMGGVIYLYFWRYHRAVQPARLTYLFNHIRRRKE